MLVKKRLNGKWQEQSCRGKATHTLVEQYLKGEPQIIRDVLPVGMFRLLKPYLDQINNIHCLERIMYSHKLTLVKLIVLLSIMVNYL